MENMELLVACEGPFHSLSSTLFVWALDGIAIKQSQWQGYPIQGVYKGHTGDIQGAKHLLGRQLRPISHPKVRCTPDARQVIGRCLRILMVFSWYSHGILMVFSWCFHRILLVFPYFLSGAPFAAPRRLDGLDGQESLCKSAGRGVYPLNIGEC
jgi:hypothetical protein